MEKPNIQIQRDWHNLHNPVEFALESFSKNLGCILQLIIFAGVAYGCVWLSR